MTQHENLSMMDTVTIKYGRTTFVTVSRTLAIILVVIFFICLLVTGLLVYSFTSKCSNNAGAIDLEEPVSAKSVVECPKQESNTERLSTYNTVAFTTSKVPDTTVQNKILPEEKDLNVRLPRSVRPVSYKLSLIPFLQENNFTFHGKVSILVNVTENCNNITLHAANLTIETVSVMDNKNHTVSIKDVRSDEDKEELMIDLADTIVKGRQYVVFIVFKGVLNDMLYGFYRSSYVENNVTKWIAATQFESTEARKAFPCFDEPAFKAKFQISIARLRNMSCISNMPIASTSETVDYLPDYVWDHFELSVPMSTYLVAFVISDFEKISNGNFSIWARSSAISQAEYSVNIGPGILKFYETFFGIKYPLPKLDMVAIPDFSSGAMENWGLVTYREAVLLYQKGVSNKMSKQRIAHVVAHELAHQWFGNLVTMEWWEDLWLNEGFATYVEYLGADAVQPKWKDLDRFVVSELHDSLQLDALKSSHPISVKIDKPSEVDELFDSISYSKGASIIRMMRHFLGESLFHKGINKYLRERMYSNAQQDDLWNTLTVQTRETETLTNTRVLPDKTTIKEIMDTWTLQTGFPVVTALEQPDGSLVLTQERFCLDKTTQDKTKWWIPISFLDSQGHQKNTWLKNVESMKMEKAVSKDTWWFLININQTGYYRVNYELDNWKKLTKQLLGNGHIAFTPTNRAQMIDDSFSLAYAQYIPYDVPLNISLYLINEREYVPWKAALDNLWFLNRMFVRSSHFDKFKVYALSLLQDFYNELGFKEFPNEDPLTALKRVAIVSLTCELGLSDCVLKSVQQFQNWKNSPNPDAENAISPDLRQVVYCTALGDGGQDEWDFAWRRYLNANVASDKEVLLAALGCSKETWILNRFLEWSISENSGIRKHDTPVVFTAVSQNPVGQDLAYRFFKTNWDRIRKYLGGGSMAMTSIVKSSTSPFNTEEEVNDFKRFFEKRNNAFGIALRTAHQSIEQGEANVRWMKNNFDFIVNWLKSFNQEISRYL